MFRSINKNRSFVARNITHKCLCIICTLLIVIFNAVPSHAVVATLGAITTAAEAGNTVGELFGRVLEDFFGLNHQCTLTEATLITINRSLDAIFANTYGYDIVNPYSGTADTTHVSSRTFGQMMADINNSIATLGVRFLRPINNSITSVDNSITGHTQQMNNALYDYQHIGQSAYSVGTTSRNTAVNTQNIRNELAYISWTDASLTYQGCFDSPQGNQLSTWTAYPDRTDFYFLFSGFTTNDDDNVYFIELPFQSWSGNNNINYINVTSASGTVINENYYDVGYTNSNGGLFLYFHNGVQYNSFYIHINVTPTFYLRNNVATVKYINSQSEDFYKVYDNILLQGILRKDFTATLSGDVIIDTTDIIDAIDDLSLVDNDVKLTPVIDTNLPTNGTNIVDRLRMYFSTGVTVNQFFNAVDDAELGWYDQDNSDVINTLSGGYVNLYE